MTISFNKIAELENTLMIVDMLNLAFRWKHMGALEFKDDMIRTIESLKKSYKAKWVILACDKGSSSYRKEIYPEYKQNRTEKFAEQSEEEKLEFEMFFKEFSNTIDYLTDWAMYPVLRFDKVEADDIAAYIVKTRKKYPEIEKIVLVSSDKDWDLLVQPGVMRFSYVTRKEVTNENWSNHYDWNQDEYISIKCLQGDPGDNVIGIAGIGPKKALALVKEYGSTYDIIASLPIASKYKHIQNLNAFGADRLMLNYQLMDLLEFCDEAIGKENCAEIDTTLRELINATG